MESQRRTAKRDTHPVVEQLVQFTEAEADVVASKAGSSYNLCRKRKEKGHKTPMEELNVPHYRLRCSVALYNRKVPAGQEPRSSRADIRRPPVAQTDVHANANGH